jgi:hypothetical protein
MEADAKQKARNARAVRARIARWKRTPAAPGAATTRRFLSH